MTPPLHERSHYTEQLATAKLGSSATVCGWVHFRRDLGGLIFLEIRDCKGLVQVVFDPKQHQAFQEAERVRKEYVVACQGIVSRRPQGTENTETLLGQLEIQAQSLHIFSVAQALPFYPDEHQTISEEVRLRYRYLDLRRQEMSEKLRLRARVTHVFRTELESQGFVDIETPILTKATPEGARDYLVPSRVHKGQFFALPQSPQLYKQLLMISGFDRYYQIARCFRDEDLRADRQPEFTQLDIETSFLNETHIMNLMETLFIKVFQETLNVTLPSPFPKMTYSQALEQFGCDRPDLRNPLRICEISDLLMDCEFPIFKNAAQSELSRVAALKLPNGATRLSRKDLEGYGQFVSLYGAKGLAYIKINDLSQGVAGLQSPLLKFLSEAELMSILDRVGAASGDLIFFGADERDIVNEALSALRIRLGQDHQLLKAAWEPLWVVDFPMFERDSGNTRWQAVHHPFTAPAIDHIQELRSPGQILARAYDLVLNGTEMGGGSIRIHDETLQKAVFEVLGLEAPEVEEKFGFLLDALKSGCPPHGGIALGLDRLIMHMTGAQSIRDVIAFPKTQTASCPLTQAPSSVKAQQLQELGLRTRQGTE